MHKRYYNILVSGFPHKEQEKLVILLNNCQEFLTDTELNIQTTSDYDQTLTILNENFYKVCFLNSQLDHDNNHRVIDEIQGNLNIQNKNTAIINIQTLANTKNCSKHSQETNCFNLHKAKGLCLDEIPIEQLNEYWLTFIIKTAVDKLVTQKEIKRLSHYDNLTGLVNRNLYLNHLNHAMALAEREKRFCTLIYLDVNDFKAINDKYGFKAGDNVLIECAQRIKKSIRSTDIAARLGSDEFAILLENCHPHEAQRIILDLKQAMSLPFKISNNKLNIEFSIDNASYPDDCSDKSTFLSDIREAHYLAKTV